MKLFLLGAAFLVALFILIQKVRQANKWEVDNNTNHNPRQPRRIGLIAFAAMILFGSLFVVNLASADEGSGDETEETTTTTEAASEPDQALFDCPDVDEDPEFYELGSIDFGLEDDDTRRLNSVGGTLVGNGPPLDADSDNAAAEDLFARTAENPKLTVELAYAFRLEGFTPDQEELDEVNAAPAAFIHQLTANLIEDEELWVQTRQELCLEMAYSYIVGDWKDRDVVQFASRPHTFTVAVGEDDVELSVRSVLLQRDPRPEGMDLLWMRAYNGDDVDSAIDVAVDMEFAWVTTFGEVPEALEEFPQDEDATEGETGQDDVTDNGGDSGSEGGDTGGGSGGDSGGDNGGHGGGSGGGCGGSGCGTGGGDTGGDGGSGCTHDCPGQGGDDGCVHDCPGDGDDGCPGCPTTTTTTRPPSTTATTQPPTTTTTRPPTTTTTAPEPTTTTTVPKDPPPMSTPSTVCNDPDRPGCG